MNALRLPKSTPFVPQASTLSTVVFGAAIIAALYFAREVFVPIALAVLLSFALAPLVRLLQRVCIPRSVAVLLVVLVSFAAILALGTIVVTQVNQLAEDLPRYQSTLREKVQTLRGATAGNRTLERAAEVLQDLGTELGKTPVNQPTSGPSDTPDRPVTVEIRQPAPGALQTIVAVITPLIHPLATIGIVFIFVIFILLQREDLRNRLIRLAGVKDLQRTTAAIDDAGHRLSRLLLTQLALNAAFGVVIGTGLFIIGVPSAPLWGILAMILRFVPYIGAAMAAIFPLAVAAAVGPGWSMVILTGLLFVVVEPLTGHVIEPFVQGRSSGLTPVAVITAATFWTWLWGPIGLVLATPLTVCLVVIGRHVDRLEFLNIMFGDEPVLSPAELVYQRMLAGDAVEIAEQAELFLKESPLSAFYEDVLLQSLNLAHEDAERGELDDDRLFRVREATAEIIDDLSAHDEDFERFPKEETGESAGPAIPTDTERAINGSAAKLAPAWPGEAPVLCMPGHGPLDDMFALVIAQMVRRRGLGTQAEAANALSMERFFSLDTEGIELVCLCYLGVAKPTQIRYAVKRLRRRLPHAIILVSLTEGKAPGTGVELPLALPEDIAVKNSLSATVEKILALSRHASQTSGVEKLSAGAG